MNENKMGTWLLPILGISFLLNQVQSDISIPMPNTNDIRSVSRFASYVQHYMNNNYKLNDSHQSFANRNSDFSQLYKDMTILLLRSETIAEKSFDDYLQIFLKKFTKYELNNSSLTQTTSTSLNEVKNRLQNIDGMVKNILKTYGNVNNASYWCAVTGTSILQYLSLLSGSSNDLFFDLTSTIVDQLQEYNTQKHICNSEISLQREVYLFIKTLMKYHVQKHILSMYTWALKYKCSRQNTIRITWNDLSTIMTRKFVKKFEKCINLSSKTLQNLPRDIYQCEFKKYVKGYTYLELERMQQIFIENEYDLNKENTCTYDCNFPEKSLVSNYENDGTECEEIFDCKLIPSQLEICKLHHQPKRLEWFKFSNQVYGSNDTSVCSGQKTELRTSSWWFHVCSYCMCTCKGRKSSKNNHLITNTISFRDQTSDTNNNMVVVGVRFVHQNSMIHAQIKVGKILPRGKIDKLTLSWKAVENIIYDGEKNEHIILENNFNSSLVDSVDYGYLNSMDLNDVIAPKNHVVTGVRFRHNKNWYTTQKNTDKGPVELNIQVTPYDYYTGKLLNLKPTRWMSPSELKDDDDDDDDNNVIEKPKSTLQTSITREELVLDEPDNPIKSSENVLDSQAHQFIKFRHSDEIKDGGQSTVPYLDGQPVEGNPEGPISGVGVIHKGMKGYGGFLAFRIHDIDLSDYMNYHSNEIKN